MITASNIFTSEKFQKVFDVVIDWCMDMSKNLLIALLILIIGRRIIKWVLKLMERSYSKSTLDPMVAKFASSLVKFLLYAVLIVAIVGVLGIPTSSFIAALSAAGLAIGLALQGSLSNFAGGVLILIFKPFTIGDYIKEDTNGNEGTVVGIDLFYTRLKSSDNKTIVVPNGNLANSSLTNFTSQKMRRLDLTVGISYDADIKLAKQVLLNVITDNELVLKSEEIKVFVSSLDESQITIGTRVWTLTDDYWTAKWELLERYKEELDANGIEIPFNQLSVTINEK
jgi:small conductance mechanosensitive channel